MSYCVLMFLFRYVCFIRLFLQRYEKRFIVDTPACIDIDFSLFNKESVMLSKKT